MNISAKLLLVLLTQIFLFTKNLEAQNTFPSSGSAGIGTTTPNASSALEIKSTTQGLLISRMTKAQRDAIVTPATGLMVYQTNSTPGFYYYSGTAWTAITVKSKGWSLTGNAGTASGANFIGTTDAQPLMFKVNNTKAGFLDFTGNIGFGLQSLSSNTGDYNSAFGYQALYANTTGSSNTANGFQAIYSNTTGYQNTANGRIALFYNTTGYNNTANGFGSLYSNTAGYNNTANGSYALTYNTIGTENTANGAFALNRNTTGVYNTANGSNALYFNTTGYYNTGNGYQSLYSNTTGYNNTANGENALYFNTTGFVNTANGGSSLYSNTSGYANTANGSSTLFSNTTGSGNTANGGNALFANTTGWSNTAIGFYALYNNITGSNNTAVGPFADVSPGNLTYATAIGSDAIVDASNKVRVGHTAVTSIGGQVGWSTFSDGRYKKNIKEDVKGLSFINKLRPITYTVDINGLNEYYNKGRKHDSTYEKMKTSMQPSTDEAAKIVYNGFIAQDVEAAAKKLNYEFSGVDKPKTKDGLYGLRYADFVVPLVKAVQELSSQNENLLADQVRLKSQNDKQQEINESLQKQIDELRAMRIPVDKSDVGFTSNLKPQTSNFSLEQNIPNPFNNSTLISYTLSESFSSAQIIVTDKSGKLIKQVPVSATGKGSLRIDASSLPSATYQYSLLVDGKLIDTKQMILTK